MGNIKLTNLGRNLGDKTPTQPSQLSNHKNNVDVIYNDIKLDINDISKEGIFLNSSINSEVSKKDLELLINEKAVINSVKNWLTTSQYTRLLNPDLNFNLTSYIFEGVNEYTAYFLGLDIMQRLPFYEPRIRIDDCEIVVDYTNDRFIINLAMSIPTLNNKIINLTEVLDSTGYTTL